MSADEADPRATRLAAAILAVLVLFVPVANLVWPEPPPPDPVQPRMAPSTSPFPAFSMGATLRVVPLATFANLSTRLLMTSLQGLVNRAQVEIYLDVRGVSEDTSRMRSFLESRYRVTTEFLASSAALDAYAPRAAGLVVIDPSRPESVDIGTMVAAQRDALLVGPDLAPWLRDRYGLPVLLDYAASDWAPLGPIGAYDRALRDLLPGAAPTLLAILPPDRWATRDYLIATRTFVFYLPQGFLASPQEVAATHRILRATPRGIPIVGWFATPTITEENAFVQMASAEGKFVVGVQDVPNLSVLTALGRNESFRQAAPPPVAGPLRDTTYVVLGVSDGDNLDFASHRMRELWSEPARGTMPIAWSLNPLLVELAPPLLASYYDTATPSDEFIAAPSGAGYLYPDYLGSGDLASYLAFSRRYLQAADMDVVWLLNAFPASEVPYRDATLSAYVDGLRPRGIILDYDDQPQTRDAWVQAGDQAVAPIVRSTHFWTTKDNVLGKIDAAASAWGGGPHFVWLTLYPFRFDLNDARDLLGSLAARLPGGIEVVGPTEFFARLDQAFVRHAQVRLREADADPLASFLFGRALDAPRVRLADAEGYLVTGRPDSAAYLAFLALEDLRTVAQLEILVVSLLVLVAGTLVAFVAARPEPPKARSRGPMPFAAFPVLVAGVALLVFGLREALEQDLWTYPSIFLGIALAGIHRPLSTALDRAYPDRAPVAAALLALIFAALAIRTSVAFPLALVGVLIVLDSVMRRIHATSSEILLGSLVGTAAGFVGRFDLATFTAFAVLLVLGALAIRGPPFPHVPRKRKIGILPGFVLALPLSALAVASSYSLGLRLGIAGDALLSVSGMLLVVAPVLAVFAFGVTPEALRSRLEIGGLALAAAFGGLALGVQGSVPTFLALLGLTAALSAAALATLEVHTRRGGDPREVLATAALFLPLFVLFVRTPPIVYSLALAPLPEFLEYALYAPPAITAAVALVLAIRAGVRGLRRARMGKDYPAAVLRGTDHP